MRSAAITILAIIGLAGCEPIATDDTPPVPSASTPSSSTPSTGAPAANNPDNSVGTVEPTARDNTAINERDADGATKTPIDQDEDQADVTTTAEIRKRVVAADGMSINAQNAKIITSKGKVTLRGPVDNQTERDAIDRIAREVAGDANVENLLEIAP
jgi:hyperosmotically inducible periplasmic protein